MTTTDIDKIQYESATPYAEFLIRSIAEQGYSLETSLADLIDNSVTANATRIEVLINTEEQPFTLYLADDGEGMDKETLKKCMRFPSASVYANRATTDLGRFGLGMKTASFSQTRRLTVLSKSRGGSTFNGRTWDVDYLRAKQEWRIIVNSQAEVDNLLANYQSLSKGFISEYDSYLPNTIVIWQGLYKFEEYLDGDDKSSALKAQITQTTTEYLSLVFHRYMERKHNPISIRVNNIRVVPFNPFPVEQADLRHIESKQRSIKTDFITLEGFVLPSRSIEESKEANNIWTTKNKGLLDMEGLYIYRADRIILFGGWNGIIRKSPRLQLARLRVEVGNKVDHLLHLNVAKSQIAIPYDLRTGFLKYMSELKQEAEREYLNRGLRKFNSKKAKSLPQLFDRSASNKGVILELSLEFPVIRDLFESLDEKQRKNFSIINRLINNTINSMRMSHEDKTYAEIDETKASITGESLRDIILSLLENRTDKEVIRHSILPSLGYRLDTIPTDILNLLN